MLVLALAPFVVSALALIFSVGGRYVPLSDQALITLRTRDVGGPHTPLIGLYSRGEWSHPGPILFYILAPFYRLTGGRAIGISLGALAINAASVAGMAFVARRRGGVHLMLLTMLGTTLLLRTLGAEFSHDPWNCFITTLPYALLVMLAWSMWCGEAWALPVGAAVATFLAQTHVGFVLLAPPLLAWGVVGLVLAAWRSRRTGADATTGPGGSGSGGSGAVGVGAPVGSGAVGVGEPVGSGAVGVGAPVGSGAVGVGEPGGSGAPAEAAPAVERPPEPAPGAARGPEAVSWRRLAKAGAVTALVLFLLWLPPLVDVVRNTPSNLRLIVDWFSGDGDGPSHTLAQGWRVMSAQFSARPEWLTRKAPINSLTGESPYIVAWPLPVLLALVVAAGVVLWRRGRDGRALVLTLALTFVTGIVGVARTVGAAFDYRLRWTFVSGLLGLVAVAWVGWGLATRRWPGAERAIVRVALAALVVVSAVNVVTAATAGSPQGADSDAMNRLVPQVLAHLPDTDGEVVVDDLFQSGAWYARSLVLELERRGVHASVPGPRSVLFGGHRVVDDDKATVRLVVTTDAGVPKLDRDPNVRRIAQWSAVPPGRRRSLLDARQDVLDRISFLATSEEFDRLHAIESELRDGRNSKAYVVAVYIDRYFPQSAPPRT